jgi:prepilin-type processing-associated H-X9-DG protein
MSNLKQTALASMLWASDNSDRFPTTVSVTNGGTWELVSTGAVFLHFRGLSNYVPSAAILHCRADTSRIAATGFTNLANSNLSYFIALDPTTNSAVATMLAGDRNLSNSPTTGSLFIDVTRAVTLRWTSNLHNGYGNIAYADGHVEGFQNAKAERATEKMPDGVTNRVLIP